MLKLRATLGAGIGLRVKTAVSRILVLALAGGAHRELLHRCQRAIIRNALDNGIPGTAVGAVYERIAIPSVSRVKQFPEAIIADGDVR